MPLRPQRRSQAFSGYFLAAAKLNVTPENCIVFEDAPGEAACGGNEMWAIWFPRVSGELVAADIVITT